MNLAFKVIRFLWYGLCSAISVMYVFYLRAALTTDRENNLFPGLVTLALTLLIFACFQIAKLVKRWL